MLEFHIFLKNHNVKHAFAGFVFMEIGKITHFMKLLIIKVCIFYRPTNHNIVCLDRSLCWLVYSFFHLVIQQILTYLKAYMNQVLLRWYEISSHQNIPKERKKGKAKHWRGKKKKSQRKFLPSGAIQITLTSLETLITTNASRKAQMVQW